MRFTKIITILIIGLSVMFFSTANAWMPKSSSAAFSKSLKSETVGPIAPAEIQNIASRIHVATATATNQSVGRSEAGLDPVVPAVHGFKPDYSQMRQRIQSAQMGQILWHEKNGTPVYLPDLRQNSAAKTLAKTTASAQALGFMEQNRSLFRLQEPMAELQVLEVVQDDLGMQHVKMAQYYQGLPLWGHDLVLHLDRNGQPYAFNARYSPTPNIDLTLATIPASQAIAIAEEHLQTRGLIQILPGRLEQILDYSDPTASPYIWIHPDTQKPHRIWHVALRPNLRDHWYYFIDARSGAILEAYNATNFDGPTTATAVDLNGKTQTLNVYQIGSTYYMIDASRPIWQQTQPDIINDPRGALVTWDVRGQDLGAQTPVYDVTSTNNTWNDRVAVSAHSNIGRVFEYFFNTHGRKAIDNQGSTIISIIHVTEDGQAMDNAYWNGKVMAYGDGNIGFKPLAGALDVAGHELTHGVIERTVNLEYKFQSGALNESLADVFGAMVDRDDWRIGEDVTRTSYIPSGAIRNMQDPHNGGTSLNDAGWQPAHLNEFVQLNISQDNGGVHINSGIPNRACFLIANSIGREKTEKIYYRVLEARYLNSQANFIDMRLAALRAATDLYGASSPEVNAVKAGFDGVGIVGDSGTKPPEDLPPVSGSQWIAIVNAELFDNSLFLAKPTITNASTDIVQLTRTQVYAQTGNPITVSDNGQVLIFVDANNYIRLIQGTSETVISNNGVWKSVALSPDGTKLAATTEPNKIGGYDKVIYVFDLVNPDASKTIQLYTPTTQDGIKADNTLFADALDWDLSSQTILYDAYNQIPQATGAIYDYWDINLMDVGSQVIFPLFPAPPEGISLGNPSFSQTNEAIITFDLIDLNQQASGVFGLNLFTGASSLIEVNDFVNNEMNLGFPRFSPDDSRLIFQRVDASGNYTLRQITIAADKISPASASQDYVIGGQLPTWFAIGNRTDVNPEPNQVPEQFVLEQNYPNPFNPVTQIRFRLALPGQARIVVYDLLGREVLRAAEGFYTAGSHKIELDASQLSTGIYYYQLESGSIKLARKMTVLK